MTESINSKISPLSDGEFLIDPNGDIVDLTLRTEQILGWPRGEVLGRPASMYIEFEGYLTKSGEVLISDIKYYESCIEQGRVIESFARDGKVFASKRNRDAKFGVLPIVVKEDLHAAVIFVLTDTDNETEGLTGNAKYLVIIGNWFLSLWKANALAAIMLVVAGVMIVAIINGDKIGIDLTPSTPKHPSKGVTSKSAPPSSKLPPDSP